ncbi:MAG TPA: AAA family ATPase [Gaiellaceae bacterium]|nr:AAA family ATPase [Gaiellaceae bacterium]
MVVGREAELAAVEGFLDSLQDGFAALAVEGEPGIGKTTIWREAVHRAGERGYPTLVCRPAQAEAKLSFAALTDLLEPVPSTAFEALPEPQRHALEVALLRASGAGARPEPRALAAGLRSVLAGLAGDAPALLAIDDLQWLDSASAGALSFALRRLEDEHLGVLTTRRPGTRPRLDLPGGRLVELDRLSLAAIHEVLKGRLGRSLPRPRLVRLYETCGGNPLFALEIARETARSAGGPTNPLPVPADLQRLVRGRLDRLSPAAKDALLVAAALGEPTLRALAAALDRDPAPAVEEAEEAEVIELESGQIRFAHPLYAAAIYAAASTDRRRRLHWRLGELATDVEERARHLALATAEPEESVAETLESAAADADLRGAPAAAAELAELGRRLTPPNRPDSRARRELALANYTFRAGDTEHARRLTDEVLAGEASGPLRARALELLARMLHVAGTASEATASCEQALAEVGDGDDALRARIHATFALVSWHDTPLAREHARAALAILDSQDEPDPVVLSQALLAFTEAEFVTGRPLPMDVVERALQLEHVAPAPNVADRMSAALGVYLKYQGDFDGARTWLEATHRAAVEEGDDGSLPYAVGHLPQLELWTGNWQAAERYALEHLRLAEETAQPDQRRQALFNLSNVHAHMGRVDEARAEAEELLSEAEAADEDWGATNALAALGLIELSLGNSDGAAELLARNFEMREAMGRGEPLRSSADYAEALVEIGDADRAEEVVRVLEERARSTARVPLQAVGACARAQVAAAQGALDAAASALDEALAHHDQVTVPFDLARTLLTLGRLQRRRKQRKAARESLERALGIFEELGAPLWAEKTRAELERTHLREAPSDLTPSEEQVARLAAAGLRNREIAERLFVSPKTVEANLGRVYRKLGIRSRAQLGAAMGAEAEPVRSS